MTPSLPSRNTQSSSGATAGQSPVEELAEKVRNEIGVARGYVDGSPYLGTDDARAALDELAMRAEARDLAHQAFEAADREAIRFEDRAVAAEARVTQLEAALRQIGAAEVLADGDFGHELRARQDIARAALAGDTETPT